MKKSIIVPCLIGVGLLSAMLTGCSSGSQSSMPASDQANFKGSAPPGGMAAAMQQAQANFQKMHPGAATSAPGGAGAPGAGGAK